MRGYSHPNRLENVMEVSEESFYEKEVRDSDIPSLMLDTVKNRPLYAKSMDHKFLK